MLIKKNMYINTVQSEAPGTILNDNEACPERVFIGN